MAIAVATFPLFPLPGRVRVRFFPTAGANYVRIWATSAPQGSSYKAQLDMLGTTSSNSRTVVYEGYSDKEWQPFLEIGGRYILKIQEYNRDTDEGAYEFDPRGAPKETKVGTEQTVNLDIGERISQTLVMRDNGDTIDFIYYTFNDTVRETHLGVHGVKSPAFVNPSSERLRISAQADGVNSAISGMVGSTTADVIGDLDTLLEELRVDLSTHMKSTTYHDVSDDDNGGRIQNMSRNFKLFAGIAEASSIMQAAWNAHVRNTPVEVHRTASAGDFNADLDSSTYLTNPVSVADGIAATADLIRAGARHFVTSEPHKGTSDTWNVSTTLGKLMLVHKAFFEAMDITSGLPTVAQPGAFKYAKHGFSVEPIPHDFSKDSSLNPRTRGRAEAL